MGTMIMNPDEIADLFRRNLKRVRITLGISQTELARRLDTRPSFICDFEKGRKLPTIVTLARLADALGVAPAALISPESDDAHTGSKSPKRKTRQSVSI